MTNKPTPEEQAAIDTLVKNGWRIVNNPWIEDTGDFKDEGRYSMAVAKGEPT